MRIPAATSLSEAGPPLTPIRSWARCWELVEPPADPCCSDGGAYEDFFEVWPHRRDNPFTEILNRAHKYVASRRTLSEPLPWINSTLLAGDAADAVARLKQEPGGDLTILGSGQLIGSLFRRGLIDEFVLMIHPLVLGQGRRLFPDGASASLELTNSVTTTKGVVIATYRYVPRSAR